MTKIESEEPICDGLTDAKAIVAIKNKVTKLKSFFIIFSLKVKQLIRYEIRFRQYNNMSYHDDYNLLPKLPHT